MTCMAECIALLRGINVGRAKRVPMAELRDVLESLGCSEVRTLLNTGNAVFQSPGGSTRELAATVEQAIQHWFGFPVPTLVHTAREFNSIISDNPLPQAVRDPSQFLVAFVVSKAQLAKARPLLKETWSPESFAIGDKAAYLWCASGIRETRLLQAFGKVTESSITTRNWATVLKIQAVLS
jgi:uncharacterized protein (DUF1697 family)